MIKRILLLVFGKTRKIFSFGFIPLGYVKLPTMACQDLELNVTVFHNVIWKPKMWQAKFPWKPEFQFNRNSIYWSKKD